MYNNTFEFIVAETGSILFVEDFSTSESKFLSQKNI